MKRWTKGQLDIFFILPLIFFFTFQPDFLHGAIELLDEGPELAIVNEILHGKVPYRDILIVHSPFYFYLPAFFMLLFGVTLASLRTYHHLCAILTLTIAYLIGRNLIHSWLFRIFLAFLLLTEIIHPYWSLRIGGFRMGGGLFVLWFLVQHAQRKKSSFFFGAGLATAFAFLMSTEIGIFSFLASCVYIGGIKLKDLHIVAKPNFWKNMRNYLWGVGTLLVPFSLYYLWIGALGPYLYTQFVTIPGNFQILTQKIPPSFLPRLNLRGEFLLFYILGRPFKAHLVGLVYLFALGWVGRKVLKKDWDKEKTIFASISIFGILSYIFGFRGIQGDQFAYALSPFLIIVCFSLEKIFIFWKLLFRKLQEKFSRGRKVFFQEICVFCAAYGLIVIVILFFIVSPKWPYGTTGKWVLFQIKKIRFISDDRDPTLVHVDLDRIGPSRIPLQQAEEITRVTQYLKQRATPREPLLSFPECSLYHFVLDRPPISRTSLTFFGWMNPSFHEEFLYDLKKTMPRYALRSRRPVSELPTLRKGKFLPHIVAFVDDHYIRVKEYGTLDIYEYRPSEK